ncbi:hypothetical protein Tco_0206107 [Tanacetum coccineum]
MMFSGSTQVDDFVAHVVTKEIPRPEMEVIVALKEELKMKDILRKDKCLETIGERSAEVTDDSKWDEMEGNAIANLHLVFTNGVLSSIKEKKSAKEI